MAVEDKTLALFEIRLRELIVRFNELKAEKVELCSHIEALNTELANTKADLEISRHEYNSLKMAKMIEISDGDLESAKAKLSKLIRDVNKCITLMSKS